MCVLCFCLFTLTPGKKPHVFGTSAIDLSRVLNSWRLYSCAWILAGSQTSALRTEYAVICLLDFKKRSKKRGKEKKGSNTKCLLIIKIKKRLISSFALMFEKRRRMYGDCHRQENEYPDLSLPLVKCLVSFFLHSNPLNRGLARIP